MGGIYKENYKRISKKISVGASDATDLVRVEDLGSLVPVADLSASGFLTEAPDLSASGFVVGPASVTTTHFAVFDGASGKLIKQAPSTFYNFSTNTVNFNNRLLCTNEATFNLRVLYLPLVATTNGFNANRSIVLVRSTASSGNLWSVGEDGFFTTIKDADGVATGAPITIDGNGRTIDGASQITLTSNYESVTVIYSSTTTEWHVI